MDIPKGANYESRKGKIKMTGLFQGFMDSVRHDERLAKELCESVGYWIQNSEEFKAYLASPKQDEQEQLWDEVLSLAGSLAYFQDAEDNVRYNDTLAEIKSKFTITRNPIK